MPIVSSDEYVQALGMDVAGPIPCCARSLTHEEARAEDRKDIVWKLSILAALGLFLLWLAPRATMPDYAFWSGSIFGALAAFVALLIWQRLRRRRNYVDPRIEIEVAETALTVIGPFGASSQPYDRVVVQEMLSVANKSSRSFVGIVFDSHLGPIRLEDDWYKNGRAAAGAVLKRRVDLGLETLT